MFVGYARGSTQDQKPELQRDALRAAGCEKVFVETVEALEEVGVGLHSLTEAIITMTPSGRLVFHSFWALAEFERSIIRERTRPSLDAVRPRGRKGGRLPKLKDADLKSACAMLKQ